MKYQFMRQHEEEFSLERMSKMLNVSRSGYCPFMKSEPSKQDCENERLLVKIKKYMKTADKLMVVLGFMQNYVQMVNLVHVKESRN